MKAPSSHRLDTLKRRYTVFAIRLAERARAPRNQPKSIGNVKVAADVQIDFRLGARMKLCGFFVRVSGRRDRGVRSGQKTARWKWKSHQQERCAPTTVVWSRSFLRPTTERGSRRESIGPLASSGPGDTGPNRDIGVVPLSWTRTREGWNAARPREKGMRVGDYRHRVFVERETPASPPDRISFSLARARARKRAPESTTISIRSLLRARAHAHKVPARFAIRDRVLRICDDYT